MGGDRPIAVDVRIVVATHRNLEELIGQGKFREDLYHRVCVFPLFLPPLRECPEDIPVLTEYALRSARDPGGDFRREYPPKPALNVSITLNCPSNPEFLCKIHVDIAVNVRLFGGHFVNVSFVFIHIPASIYLN